MGRHVELLQPITQPKFYGTLCMGSQPVELPMMSLIAVGFGFAGIMRDGITIWDEQGDDVKHVSDAEAMAMADPDHDWRIVFEGLLRGSTYQRHAPGKWLLVKQSEGFI